VSLGAYQGLPPGRPKGGLQPPWGEANAVSLGAHQLPGSFTFSTLSNSMFHGLPFTIFTSRR